MTALQNGVRPDEIRGLLAGLPRLHHPPGIVVGWEMHVQVAPNSEFIGLTAGAKHIFVVGTFTPGGPRGPWLDGC